MICITTTAWRWPLLVCITLKDYKDFPPISVGIDSPNLVLDSVATRCTFFDIDFNSSLHEGDRQPAKQLSADFTCTP